MEFTGNSRIIPLAACWKRTMKETIRVKMGAGVLLP